MPGNMNVRGARIIEVGVNATQIVVATTLPTYSGAEDVHDWLTQVKRINAANGWTTDNQKISHAISALEPGSSASRWFEGHFGSNPPNTFVDFEESVIAAFGPKRLTREAYSKVQARVQNPCESPVTYYHDKLFLLKKWQPNISEDVLVDLIVDGLQDNLKQRALTFNVKSPLALLDKLKTQVEGQRIIDGAICAAEATTTTRKVRFEDIICYRCNGKGHTASICPTTSQPRDNGFPQRKNYQRGQRPPMT